MPDIERLKPRFTSAKYAAEYLGVTNQTIYYLLDKGLLKGGYVGSKRLVEIAALEHYADNLPTVPPAAQ